MKVHVPCLIVERQLAPVTTTSLSLDRGDQGLRLDLVLRRHLRDVPSATRTRVQAWIRDGQVTVNGRPATRAAQRAAIGDEIVVQFAEAPPEPVTPAPEDVALTVLYEDDGLVIIDKAAGMVVHPTYKNTWHVVECAAVASA